MLQRLRVWGLVRPATNGEAQSVAVEFHPPKTTAWRQLGTLPAEPSHGYVDGRVRFPGSGVMRLRWGDVASREVNVRRTRRR